MKSYTTKQEIIDQINSFLVEIDPRVDTSWTKPQLYRMLHQAKALGRVAWAK